MKKRMSVSGMRFSNGIGVLLAFGVGSSVGFAPSSDEEHRYDENEGRTDYQDVDGSRQSHVFLLSQPVNFMSKMCRLKSKFDAAARYAVCILNHHAVAKS
ncbi:hypothetical protein [Rhizobium rhizogenes]|uniref:hypothetical protein n=1 Tax=Rhizobium rhizogenes TaxID=359 RepID=UPI0015740CB5|nr:hypothetical protein [Rhizobium rhizogenes]NTF42487.1 hypothetical protein [Rhizobium rhizogenes]